jgi:small subunit ribosomal protein S9
VSAVPGPSPEGPEPDDENYPDPSKKRPIPVAAVNALGRRKEATARAYVWPGSGDIRINGRPLREYFPNRVHQQLVLEPFVTVGRDTGYDVDARLAGGGIAGQAGALRLAIARVLAKESSDDRSVLKRAGLLTRDARAKERKKAGLKKARKAPQYSKR